MSSHARVHAQLLQEHVAAISRPDGVEVPASDVPQVVLAALCPRCEGQISTLRKKPTGDAAAVPNDTPLTADWGRLLVSFPKAKHSGTGPTVD